MCPTEDNHSCRNFGRPPPSVKSQVPRSSSSATHRPRHKLYSYRLTALGWRSGCNCALYRSRNAVGIRRRGKRTRSPSREKFVVVRRTFLKLLEDHPNADFDILLDIAVKTHNDTAGIHGLVPTLLVFGALPRSPIRDEMSDSLTNSPRAKMRQTELTEHQRAVDSARLRITESCQAPTVPASLNPGDDVLTWHKLSKCWDGPHNWYRLCRTGTMFARLTDCNYTARKPSNYSSQE